MPVPASVWGIGARMEDASTGSGCMVPVSASVVPVWGTSVPERGLPVPVPGAWCRYSCRWCWYWSQNRGCRVGTGRADTPPYLAFCTKSARFRGALNPAETRMALVPVPGAVAGVPGALPGVRRQWPARPLVTAPFPPAEHGGDSQPGPPRTRGVPEGSPRSAAALRGTGMETEMDNGWKHGWTHGWGLATEKREGSACSTHAAGHRAGCAGAAPGAERSGRCHGGHRTLRAPGTARPGTRAAATGAAARYIRAGWAAGPPRPPAGLCSWPESAGLDRAAQRGERG